VFLFLEDVDWYQLPFHSGTTTRRAELDRDPLEERTVGEGFREAWAQFDPASREGVGDGVRHAATGIMAAT